MIYTFTLGVLLALIASSESQDCRKEKGATIDKCDGLGCSNDKECKSGFCFNEGLTGQNTCTAQRSCASTPFSH
jgi:uncharacterized membrane protein